MIKKIIILLITGFFIVCSISASEVSNISPIWNYTADGIITVVDITQDGQYIIAGSKDCRVYVFNNKGNKLWRYDVGGEISSISTTPNGKYIVVGAKHGMVYLFDINENVLWNYEAGEHESTINSVAISSDGKYIVAGGGNYSGWWYGYIYFFNRSGKLLWTYKTGESEYGSNNVNSVAISSDGKYIVAGGGNNVYLLNKDGKLLWTYKTGGTINSVAISSDGKYIVAGSRDDNVYLFNRTGNLLWKYKTGGWVESVSITPDGKYIAVGSGDGKAYIIDTKSGSFPLVLGSYKTGGWVMSVAISSDGNYMTAGSDDYNAYLLNKTGNVLWKYRIGSLVRAIAISSNGTYAVVGSWDKHVYLFKNAFLGNLSCEIENTTTKNTSQESANIENTSTTVKNISNIEIQKNNTAISNNQESNNLEKKPLATLSISSTPSSANVYINGELKGKTPLVIELKPGDYEIKIAKPGYYAFITTKTLGIGDKLNLICNLIKINEINSTNGFGEVEVSSVPNGEIFINGISYGKTPKVIDLNPGKYLVEVYQEGYDPYSVNINVEPNKEYIISAKLTHKKTGNYILDKFRERPTINLYLPVDTFKTNEKGVIELLIRNPSVNDLSLSGDLNVNVPSDIVVEGGDGNGGAGYYSKAFSVKPGESKEITLNIECQNPGRYLVHAKVYYYTGKNKDNYEVITLTKPINVIEGDTNNEVDKNSQNEKNNGSIAYIIGILVVLGAIGGFIFIKTIKNKNGK